LTSSLSGATKLSENYTTEDRIVGLSDITRDMVGTSAGYNSGPFIAGRATGHSSDKFVGTYARTNYSLDIGTLLSNEFGDRVLFYAYNYNSSTCQIRIAVTGPNGWKPSSGAAPANAKVFLDRYKTVSFRDASGNAILTATLGSLASDPSSSTEGGIQRTGNVTCAAVNTLYSSYANIKSATADY